jgi:hypothetical protein
MNTHELITLAILSPLFASRTAGGALLFLKRDVRQLHQYFKRRKSPRYYNV